MSNRPTTEDKAHHRSEAGLTDETVFPAQWDVKTVHKGQKNINMCFLKPYLAQHPGFTNIEAGDYSYAASTAGREHE